jgi:hypothetical protein
MTNEAIAKRDADLKQWKKERADKRARDERYDDQANCGEHSHDGSWHACCSPRGR